MKKTNIFRSLVVLCLTGVVACMMMACQNGKIVVAQEEMNVVPMPKEYQFTDGTFALTPSLKVVTAADSLDKVVAAVQRFIGQDIFGKEFKTIAGSRDSKGIVLSIDPALAPEAYKLTSTSTQILIEGGSAAGAFYGVQTLRQLIPAECYGDKEIGKILLPCIAIKDEPAFGYRCGLLDAARHFMTVEDVKSFIDILAMHKDNTFHFHITDDQGWRIEIKQYPELTKIGSQRKETVIGHNTPEYDGIPHGGFYTQEQIKEIVAYAADNFINVIPELDLPGHMQAALATYPNLGCRGGGYPYEVMTKWGVSKNVLCAGNDDIYIFLENVMSEMLELFPSKYFHIGGDECPKDEWKECPKCQAKMKAEGLKDEKELQSYVTARVEKFLNEHGRQVIGWEEIVEGGVSKDVIVMHWRYDEMGNAALEQGNKMIMCPLTHCYFDYFQHPDSIQQPGYGHYIPLDTAYSYDPCKGLTEAQRTQILGVQANAWTEYAKNFDEVTYMFLPRAAAMAEIAWTYDNRNYEDFCRRLASLRKLYDFYGWNYGSRQIFSPKETLDYQPIQK